MKLKYKKRHLTVKPGETLYEVSKTVKGEYKYPIVGAKLGNKLTDLNEKVQSDNTIEFYDLSTSIGNRIYSRSLEFLTTYASKIVLGNDTDIHINYSLENGIYCEIVGKKIQATSVKKIENEMKELVKQKIPFQNVIVDRYEAIKYLKKVGQIDKANTLKYITDDTISIHLLNDMYDYFYGPLVYNTSILTNFKLKYNKENSFILMYPSTESPDKINKYIEHPLTNKTYKNFYKWGKDVGITTVPQINDIIAIGQGEAVVSLYEAHYNEEISEVIEEVYKRKNKVKMILLAGPSSSGKTTTAKKIGLYLRVKGIRYKQISLDDFFVDREKTPLDENGNYDFADINALDIKLFKKQLQRILKGQKVLMPTYDFVIGKRTYKDNYIKLEKGEMLVIEGIHTLNEYLTDVVPRDEKFKIFQCPLVNLKLDNHNRIHTTDVRKIRRIVRDNTYRGNSAEETLKMWPNVDKEAKKNIYPYQDDADAIINSSLGYELSSLRIYAEPLLYGIDVNSPQYPEAKRLLKLLRNFLTISSEMVPKDSILREFIGGSIFKDYKERKW